MKEFAEDREKIHNSPGENPRRLCLRPWRWYGGGVNAPCVLAHDFVDLARGAEERVSASIFAPVVALGSGAMGPGLLV